MATASFSITAENQAGGYYSQTRGRKPEQLSKGSKNVRLTFSGQAASRNGFDDTGWNLVQDGYASSPGRMQRYAITFFAINTKVYYRKDSDGNIYDTGIALTTGTLTTFSEYQGDMYLTNATDGITRIHVTTIKTAVSAGASTIDAELGTTFRASSSGNLRIKGTNEAYSSVNTSTDVYTLTGTSSQAYAVGEIAIVVESLSSLPKGSKIIFFRERMSVIGVSSSSSSQAARWTVFFGKFATLTTWADIKDFTYGAGGSTRSSAGSSGVITNAVPTRDYLYLFKEDETYYLSVSDIDASTGASPFKLLSNHYGCANQFAATDMAGYMVWLTKNKRIMKTSVEVQAGTSTIYPDEKFDRPIKEDLEDLSSDQSNARVFYHKAKKLLFVQVNTTTGLKTFVYDNNLRVWLPPDTNKQFNGYFESGASLYATDLTDRYVYQVETGASDNGADIDCIIASGVFLPKDTVGMADWDEIIIKGKVASPSRVTFTPSITSMAGTRDAGVKVITISDASTSSESSEEVGSVPIGDGTISGSPMSTAPYPFYVRYKFYPSKGNEYQHQFRASGDGHSYQIESWTLTGKLYSSPLITAK